MPEAFWIRCHENLFGSFEDSRPVIDDKVGLDASLGSLGQQILDCSGDCLASIGRA